MTTDTLTLNATLDSPLSTLENQLVENHVKIERWFRKQWQEYPPPLTSSVDLRNSGFKLAPIDTNLFPAGFNNLTPEQIPLAVQAVQTYIQDIYQGCERIVLIPESHTRNMRYFESLHVLTTILLTAGYDVRLGTLNPDITKPETVEISEGRTLVLEPVTRVDDRLQVGNFRPCLILLNNDLSEGIPDILQGIKQPLHPPTALGWSTRLKSGHFRFYNAVCDSFATEIGLDPWLINPFFENCGQVDFMVRGGEDCVAKQSELLLERIKQKYEEYHITKPPFLILKSDSGTYGMGVMTVKSRDDIINMNRKDRTRMSKGKGKQDITRVIIQEGVYSFETHSREENAIAEPVVYMLGPNVVGGFYRIHKEKASDENLNAPGMYFHPIPFNKPCNVPDIDGKQQYTCSRLYCYGVIARLALLAAARELKEVTP